jgi:hypothetical protein
MTKPSILKITALFMAAICIYKLIAFLNLIPYVSARTQYRATQVILNYFVICAGIYLVGIISSIGLFFKKNWARLLTLFITVFLLYQTFPPILRFFVGNYSIKESGECLIYILFGIWCLYYLNRSDIKAMFKKEGT